LAMRSSGNLTHGLFDRVDRAQVYFPCVRSIVSMSPNGRVTLPAETRRALGLEGESFFEVHQQGSAIVLRPVAMVPLAQARKSPRKGR